jgi:hypothetical protein
MLLPGSPGLCHFDSMVESDHDEERLARVERMLAQCRKEAAALKAIVASKVVVIVVDAAPPLGAKHSVLPATPKRSN